MMCLTSQLCSCSHLKNGKNNRYTTTTNNNNNNKTRKDKILCFNQLGC